MLSTKKIKLLIIIILFFMQFDCVLFAIAKKVITPTNRHHSLKRQQNKHENISKLLDKLLENYDNSLRPNFGLEPAVVEVDLMVRSMGPVSEIDMTYSMDCYFRQSWVDTRLAFEEYSSNITTSLTLSISMLAKIWKPDTFFFNGKQSYLHTITTPNKFVRLFKNGRVLYSSRLTIKAACPMNLENFPMDVQRCPLKLGSFGYTTSDVLYRWNSKSQVQIANDMTMSQFNLIDVPTSNLTDHVVNSLQDFNYDRKDLDYHKGMRATKEYSILLVSFHLQRHMGNFLIQVYGPCILLVVLSWVSFWLNREATADRVSLGITTVLTMTFLGLEARTDLPKVPYPTALDFFVFLSFVFIFATILQFAVVHYFTKYGSGECYFNFYEDSSDSDNSGDETDDGNVHVIHQHVHNIRPSDVNCYASDNYGEVIPLSVCTIPKRFEKTEEGILRKIKRFIFRGCLTSSDKSSDGDEDIGSIRMTNERTVSESSTPALSTIRRRRISTQEQNFRRSRNPHSRNNFNSVSKIDEISRIVFPLLFLFINLFYWYVYLSGSKRMSKQA